MKTVRDIIDSGELISSKTKNPLSDEEKAEYKSRAAFYFIHEDTKWKSKSGRNDSAPVYDGLLRLLKMEDRLSDTLKCTVQTICQTPVRDESEYVKFLEQLRRDVLPPPGVEPLPTGFHEENLSEMQLIKKIWGHVQNNKWGYISSAGGSTVGKAVISSAVDEIALAFQGTIQPYNIATGVRCTAMVSGLYLAGTIGYNVYEAARGRRSWRRVGKNVTEEVASVTAGALAGIGISALLAPFTGGISLICGALVGIAANIGVRCLSKSYTGRIFNIPEDEMLEKAFATLGTNQSIDNNGLSKAYREKSRQFHPDKFYSKHPNATEAEKDRNLWRFLKVQAAFAMVMAAREKDIDEYENARKHFERIEEDELEKKCVGMGVKLWASTQVQKLRPIWVKTKNSFNYAAINGILPVEVFEDTDVENAVAAETLILK